MAISTLIPAAASRAADATRANLQANLRELTRTQPRLIATIENTPLDPEPVYARDGSLTAFGPDGRWWHDCSVPLRAAEAMLATLDVKGRVACMLAPTLGAQVRVALDRMRPDQALVALCPDAADVRVMVESHDFSAGLIAHRLWFAWGDDWVEQLRCLFDERPGLATPAQFVRLPTTAAEDVERMVPAAQAVFAEVNAGRAREVNSRRGAWHPPTAPRPRLCVIAPSHFRLWDDAGASLADALRADEGGADRADVAVFDPDDPTCSSALALLQSAGDCHAVCAADTSRVDLPGVVPDHMPWVTWVTRPMSIPPVDSAGRADVLVLADPTWQRSAQDAGWPAERVSTGGWPVAPAAIDSSPQVLGVITDTLAVAMPEALGEFSSHQLLWTDIAAELAADPFSMRDNSASYLERQMKRRGVSADGFDSALFLDRLIFPTYVQAVVRFLIREKVPVRLFGRGWDETHEFREHAAGPVTSRAAFLRIREEIAAVVDVSPPPGGHPLHRLGLPVVRADSARELIAQARRALAGDATAPQPIERISLATIGARVRREGRHG